MVSLSQTKICILLLVFLSILLEARGHNFPTDLTTPGWIVTGPNKSVDGVPSCSYCLQVFTEASSVFRHSSDPNDFSGMPVYVSRCRSFQARELWQYSNSTNQLVVEDRTGQLLCMQYAEQDNETQILVAMHCNAAPKQKWFLDLNNRIRSGVSGDLDEPLYLVQTQVLEYPNLFLVTDAGISDLSNGVTSTQFTFQKPDNYWSNLGLSLRTDAKNTVPPNSTQNVIQSGGFERSTVAATWPAGANCSATPTPAVCSSYFFTPGEIFSMCGWAIISPPEWISGRQAWRPARGNSSLLLSNQAVINQTIPTVANSTYVISFNLAGYLVHSPFIDDYVVCANTSQGSPDLKVQIHSGASAATASFTVTEFSTDGHLKWLNRTTNFTAITNITVIVFSSLVDNACGPLIDEVRVVPQVA